MSGIIGTSHSKSKVIGRSQDTAKAWIRYDQSTPSIKDEFGVSSVTDNATGLFTVNFDAAQPNANYAVVGMSEDERYLQFNEATAPTTTAFKLQCTHYNSNEYDMTDNAVIVFGD